MLDDYVVEERECDDGSEMYPREIFNLVAQTMYDRRNKMDPFYNQLVLAGFRDGKPFLGMADLTGTNFEENHISTGYGAHIAITLLRKHYRPDLTKDEAIKIVKMCMTVLYYRDKQTINKVQICTIDANVIQFFNSSNVIGNGRIHFLRQHFTVLVKILSAFAMANDDILNSNGL